ncbi:hypothetical protein H8I69_01640 [Serratia fonticola]|uniref:hypothetical protein n=1 Tax=Serratia fonticola TaxID=47917 RepID=UPI0015C5C553|nr:hypothetical protein [Serratia fonticola]MBC3377820.1 hypothetical protein [Serratia fonticola]NYA37020.1 hypothetical protein [Serratia fonticola]
MHSINTVTGVALEYLCQSKSGCDVYVERTCNTEILFETLSATRPDLLIIDGAPRCHFNLIRQLRANWPVLLLMATQHYFLFSDRIMQEYFGRLLLKEYDALLAGFPNISAIEHVGIEFAGPEWAGCQRSSLAEIPPEEVLIEINQWLRRRLAGVVTSAKARAVAIDLLSQGYTPAEAGKLLGRSHQVIYHHRQVIEKALRLKNPAMELIPSLTFSDA